MKIEEVIEIDYLIDRLAYITKGKLENISMEFTSYDLALEIEYNIGRSIENETKNNI